MLIFRSGTFRGEKTLNASQIKGGNLKFDTVSKKYTIIYEHRKSKKEFNIFLCPCDNPNVMLGTSFAGLLHHLRNPMESCEAWCSERGQVFLLFTD